MERMLCSMWQDVERWTIPAKYGEGGTLCSPGSAATERRSMSAPRERRSPQTTIPKCDSPPCIQKCIFAATNSSSVFI